MQVRIDGTVKEVPFLMSMITLSQCIDYYEKYGRSLDSEFLILQERTYTDEEEKDKQLEKHIDKKALAWYSFWTGYDLFEVKEEPFIIPLLKQYRILYELLTDEDDIVRNFGTEVEWKGDTWCISDFKDCDTAAMSFNQIQILRKVFNYISQVKKNKWDAMTYLCAIFFRKKNESIKDILIYPDYPGNDIRNLEPPKLNSERVELLKDLPMNFVMSIKMLVSTMEETDNIFKTAFVHTAKSLAPLGSIINNQSDFKILTNVYESLTAKLEAGTITQDEYDQKVLQIITIPG